MNGSTKAPPPSMNGGSAKDPPPASMNAASASAQQQPPSQVVIRRTPSKSKKVLLDARRDLDNANFIFGFISNPIRDLVLRPALAVATEVVPAVASAVPVPFADDLTAFGLSIPFNTARIAYTVVHGDDGKRVTTIVEDAKREIREFTDLSRLEEGMDNVAKGGFIGWWGYIIALAVELFEDPKSRLSEWAEATRRFTAYLNASGISKELEPVLLNRRVHKNMSIIGNVENIVDSWTARRERAALGPEARPYQTSIREVAKLMRYCTASYGRDAMYAQEIISSETEVSLAEKLNITEQDLELGSDSLKKKVCEHVGIPEDFIRYFMLGYGGNMKLLRHYISVDHDLGAVVLVIRGTQSTSGWNIDFAGYARPFCNGVAHTGIADMADAILKHSKHRLLEIMDEVPTYPLYITGQSLGSGVACLLNLLFHMDKDLMKKEIRCHAYGGPPVYLQVTANPYVDKAMKNGVAYIHREDCVVHMSVNSVHRLLAKLTAVDRITEHMSEIDMDLIAAGRKLPTRELVEAVKNADTGIRAVEGAPRLILPVASCVWFSAEGDYEVGKRNKFNMMLCDASKVADLGLHMSVDMFSDHPPNVYETRLNEIERIGWDVLYPPQYKEESE